MRSWRQFALSDRRPLPTDYSARREPIECVEADVPKSDWVTCAVCRGKARDCTNGRCGLDTCTSSRNGSSGIS